LQSNLKARWQGDDRELFVAVYANRVVGCVAVKIGADDSACQAPQDCALCTVWRMSVSSDARQIGVGQKLMRRVEDWCVARGKNMLQLVTTNPVAVEFYTKRCGFRRLGWSEAIGPWFQKRLSGLKTIDCRVNNPDNHVSSVQRIMLQCDHPGCGKRYAYPSGLMRHKRAHGHGELECTSQTSRSRLDKVLRRGRRSKRRQARINHFDASVSVDDYDSGHGKPWWLCISMRHRASLGILIVVLLLVLSLAYGVCCYTT
jgi:GNAT superfamily N-acetyltransferase